MTRTMLAVVGAGGMAVEVVVAGGVLEEEARVMYRLHTRTVS